MSDRELLEMAAKAASISGRFIEQIPEDGYWSHMCYIGESGTLRPKWNPLADDGDALRLAVSLKLNIQLEYSPTYHYADNDDYECLEGANGCCTKAIDCGGDPCAATRRAITRAAAEIGWAMP